MKLVLASCIIAPCVLSGCAARQVAEAPRHEVRRPVPRGPMSPAQIQAYKELDQAIRDDDASDVWLATQELE